MRKLSPGWLLGLVLVLVLGACMPLAPATPPVAVEATGGATPTAAPTATTEPTATAAPTATAEPTAAPVDSVPDPRTDPMAALLYASSADAMKTAEFEYEMVMTVEPADDAAAEALGPALDMLSAFEMSASGAGAMEVVEPQSMKNKMRMQLNMEVAGKQIGLDMVMIEDTIWVRAGKDAEWEKSKADAAQDTLPGGMDPNQMLSAFRDATDVEWVEDTELDGESVSHLRFTVDPTKFDLGSLTDSLSEGASTEDVEAMMREMTIDAEVWLTAEKLQPRRQRMVISMILPLGDELDNPDARLRMNLEMTMRMLTINEPVTIEPPTE